MRDRQVWGSRSNVDLESRARSNRILNRHDNVSSHSSHLEVLFNPHLLILSIFNMRFKGVIASLLALPAIQAATRIYISSPPGSQVSPS